MTQVKKNRKWLRLAFILYPLLSCVAFVLPFLPRYYINKALAGIQGYTGHIGSIVITPFIPHITVAKLSLDTIDTNTGDKFLFISAELIELRIDWIKLWHGILCLEIKVSRPSFTIFKKNLEKVSSGAKASAKGLDMEIDIQKVEITDGRLEYIDTSQESLISIPLTGIQAKISELHIGKDSTMTEWAAMALVSDILGGKLDARMKMDVRSKFPSFVLDALVKNIDLMLLNDLFRAYAKFDVNRGEFSMRTNITAVAGKYAGSVDSQIDNLQILGPEDKNDNILSYLWEAIVGAVADLIEDHQTEEISAKIDFEKPFKNPGAHIFIAVVEAVGTAFLHGLTPHIKKQIKVNL